MSKTKARKHISSGKVYKVWLDIEEYDIEEGSGELIDNLNVSSTETFATPEEAEAYCQQINKRFAYKAPNGVDHD